MMNEVYCALEGFLEELQSDRSDRDYVIKTEGMEEAQEQLNAKFEEFEKLLERLGEDDRSFLEDYMLAVDLAHFNEEHRAYCQGIMDGVQMLGELGVIRGSKNVEKLIQRLKGE